MKTPSILLGESFGMEVEELPLNELVPFENHPFQVAENDEFYTLMESIAQFGVTTPILVRPKGRGAFEIISGHRRSKACERLGLSVIPAIIQDLSQEEAVIFMVDSNIQREELLPSEKAFAYKMKLEAIKEHKKANPKEQDITLSSRELLAQHSRDSSVQIQRYIRLTLLQQDLLKLTDQKKIPFQAAVDLSYLSPETQETLAFILQEFGILLSLVQSRILKRKGPDLSEDQLLALLLELKVKPKKLTLQADMNDYFPADTSYEEMEEVILQLLKEWKMVCYIEDENDLPF